MQKYSLLVIRYRFYSLSLAQPVPLSGLRFRTRRRGGVFCGLSMACCSSSDLQPTTFQLLTLRSLRLCKRYFLVLNFSHSVIRICFVFRYSYFVFTNALTPSALSVNLRQKVALAVKTPDNCIALFSDHPS